MCVKCDLKLFLLQSAQIFCHQNNIDSEDMILTIIEMAEELTSGEDWATDEDFEILVEHSTLQ